MMPKQIPTIANDRGMQEDAYRYATERMKNLRVGDVQIALSTAYKNGAISAFATGYRCGYAAVEPEYKDTINFYKRRLNTLAQEAYKNALKRGKINPEDDHETRWSGIWQELDEFHHATDNPSEHLPQYTERQEELADVLICCLTELHHEGVDVQKIIEEKITYNNKR